MGLALRVMSVVELMHALLPRACSGSSAVVLDGKSSDRLARFVSPNIGSSNYMAARFDILQSKRVAGEAAALRLAQPAGYQTILQKKT